MWQAKWTPPIAGLWYTQYKKCSKCEGRGHCSFHKLLFHNNRYIDAQAYTYLAVFNHVIHVMVSHSYTNSATCSKNIAATVANMVQSAIQRQFHINPFRCSRHQLWKPTNYGSTGYPCTSSVHNPTERILSIADMVRISQQEDLRSECMMYRLHAYVWATMLISVLCNCTRTSIGKIYVCTKLMKRKGTHVHQSTDMQPTTS